MKKTVAVRNQIIVNNYNTAFVKTMNLIYNHSKASVKMEKEGILKWLVKESVNRCVFSCCCRRDMLCSELEKEICLFFGPWKKVRTFHQVHAYLQEHTVQL